jgi:chromosome segregation ATPase
MLDEARKLMIDADAQQRTVMDSKTDLQFTLASSSDADIAKAVGFYEAEVQKLKTCISKGKEDAIAEYEKDLAEIEKRKKEITAKTFEVKAPQEDKKNKKKLEDMNLNELYAEQKRLREEKKTRLSRKPTASVQDLDDRIKKTEARINELKNPAPAPTPGGRRFTRRRRI